MTLTDVYDSAYIKGYAIKLTGNPDAAADLIGSCVEICLKKLDVVKGVESRGKFKSYFCSMLRYEHYRVSNLRKIKTVPIEDDLDSITDDNYSEDIDKKVRQTLEKMHFYTRGMLELYKDNSYRQIAKKTGIPYVSVSNGVNAAKEEFKKIYNTMKIAVIMRSMSGVEYHRLARPILEMSEDYNIEIITINPTKGIENSPEKWNDNWADFIPKDVTHVLFNRNISVLMKPESVLLKIRKRGIKVIMDIDDYWHVHKNHELYQSYKATNYPACMIANIMFSDIVWTSNAKLADKIKEYNPNVYVAKNCISVNDKQFSEVKLQYDGIVYTGGTSHIPDLRLLKGVTSHISVVKTLKSERLSEWLPNIHYFEPRHPLEYAKCYSHNYISLIPLQASMFNSMKSELKLIEAGVLGMAAICSDAQPYSPHLKHGKNCLKSDHKSWQKNINKLVGNHAMQYDLGQTLKEYVDKNFVMKKENKLRFDTL